MAEESIFAGVKPEGDFKWVTCRLKQETRTGHRKWCLK